MADADKPRVSEAGAVFGKRGSWGDSLGESGRQPRKSAGGANIASLREDADEDFDEDVAGAGARASQSGTLSGTMQQKDDEISRSPSLGTSAQDSVKLIEGAADRANARKSAAGGVLKE